MQPEQASFLLNHYLPIIKSEFATNKRVLAAIPEDKRNYSPHPVCRNGLDLAWHLAFSDVGILDGIARGEYPADDSRPASVQTIADVRTYYEKEFPAALGRVKAMRLEKLTAPLNFYGLFTAPAVEHLSILVRHSVHHRGQLSAYLRPMGAKVPAIYGMSADETLFRAVGA